MDSNKKSSLTNDSGSSHSDSGRPTSESPKKKEKSEGNDEDKALEEEGNESIASCSQEIQSKVSQSVTESENVIYLDSPSSSRERKNQKALKEVECEDSSEEDSDGDETSLQTFIFRQWLQFEEKTQSKEDLFEANGSSDQQPTDTRELYDIVGDKFICKTCQLIFYDAQAIQLHLLHNREAYVCTTCGKVVHTKKKLRRHLYEKHTEAFICYECGETFDHMSSLVLHKRRHQAEDDVKCNKCGKLFVQDYDLQQHIQHNPSCDQEYRCAICYRYFARRSNLDVHQRKHGVVKQYQCHVCSKCFINSE